MGSCLQTFNDAEDFGTMRKAGGALSLMIKNFVMFEKA